MSIRVIRTLTTNGRNASDFGRVSVATGASDFFPLSATVQTQALLIALAVLPAASKAMNFAAYDVANRHPNAEAPGAPGP